MGKRITALKAQQRNHQRVSVYLDEEFAFGLARIVAAWLQVGQELSDEKIAELQSEDRREVAFQRALRFIEHRDRSEAEIIQHLKEQELDDEVLSGVVERLKRSQLVNDRRFAKTWIDNRSEFHPRSRRALAFELRQKGIHQEAIEEALDSIDDEELAYQAAAGQYRKYGRLDWPEFRQKMSGFLARRGFSYGTSAPVVRRVWEEAHSPEPDDEQSTNDHPSDYEVDL